MSYPRREDCSLSPAHHHQRQTLPCRGKKPGPGPESRRRGSCAMRPELSHADAVAVTLATGARGRLLRLVHGEPSLDASYVSRKQVEVLLSGVTTKAFENAANRVVAEHEHAVLKATAAELSLLKAAAVASPLTSISCGVQLFSFAHAAEVLIAAGARFDVVDSLRAAAVRPRGVALSGEEAAAVLAAPGGQVVQLPPVLPSLASDPAWASANYSLSASQLTTAPLADELAALDAFLTAQLRLDRESSSPVAQSTLNSTRTATARVLGYWHNVAKAPPPYTLAALLDGTVLAAYASFSLGVRSKSPVSVATELAGCSRVLTFLATKELDGVDLLQAGVRRLRRQLMAMPRDAPPTVEQLTKAGTFVDLGSLWAFCDELFDQVDFEDRSAASGRRVHDTLMVFLGLRENPVLRPACMFSLKVPGATSPCSECARPACRGNSWREGSCRVFDLIHYKTNKSHGVHTVTVAEGSKTARLLDAYTGWARAGLLAAGVVSDAMWVSTAGRPFASVRTFSDHLPKVLAPCADLTWTRLRHVVACGIVPLANQEELAGLADAMTTSVRKLTTIYQNNRKEVSTQLGGELYRTLAKPRAVARPAPPQPASKRAHVAEEPPPAAGASTVEVVLDGVRIVVSVYPSVRA